jgi:hypothetical protein
MSGQRLLPSFFSAHGVTTGILFDSPISFFTKQQREQRWQTNLARQQMEAAPILGFQWAIY